MGRGSPSSMAPGINRDRRRTPRRVDRARPASAIGRRRRVPGEGAGESRVDERRWWSSFRCDDGHRLTREAVRLTLRRMDGWRTDPKVRELLDGRAELDLVTTRNVAILLTGWFGALRRSNIVALRWADLKRGPNGDWEMRLTRSKTDQEGNGRTLLLPRTTSGGLCPARAMDAWREAVDQEFGEPPAQTWPVFFRLTVTVTRHAEVAAPRA